MLEKLVIHGGRPLFGTISVSGSKNAALPILAATILAEGETILENIPDLSDVAIMCDILRELGCRVESLGKDCLLVDTSGLCKHTVSHHLAGRLRGSFLVAGPLLAKTGRAGVSLPGGCPIGARPVDLHLKGFSALGAAVENRGGCVTATCDRLLGKEIYLDFPSVGATENIMTAATMAEGQTTIKNASTEPEIVDLANFLCAMGAEVIGAGTDTVNIRGVRKLSPVRYSLISDRIEAGTYLLAGAITGGNVTVSNILPEYLKPLTAKLSEMGVPLSYGETSVTVHPAGTLRSVDVQTLPFPGFPTDMQAPITALLSISEGTGIVTETVFENRFMHAGELSRMGAMIRVAGRSAVIEGKKALTGAKVRATDLRAGAALVLAGLAAKGDTEISDIYHLDRGYVTIEEKLRSLGADIVRQYDD